MVNAIDDAIDVIETLGSPAKGYHATTVQRRQHTTISRLHRARSTIIHHIHDAEGNA